MTANTLSPSAEVAAISFSVFRYSTVLMLGIKVVRNVFTPFVKFQFTQLHPGSPPNLLQLNAIEGCLTSWVTAADFETLRDKDFTTRRVH